MKKNYKIYRYNFPTLNMTYIGQTVDIKRCTAGNYKKNPGLYQALNNFLYDYDILAVCETKDEAKILENYFIKLHDSINHGFNRSINSTPGVVFADITEDLDVRNLVVKSVTANPFKLPNFKVIEVKDEYAKD